MCRGGATEVRLRSAAASLADAHPGFTSRSTPDRRTAVAPVHAIDDQLPIGAIVIPSPSRETNEVQLVELPSAPKVLALLAFPRIAGWSDPGVLAHQFETLARLAGQVPIGKLNNIEDIFNDEHFQARGNLVSMEEPGMGPVVIPGVVPTLSETPGRVTNLGPPLGNATYEIMRELLGLSADEITRFRKQKII